MIRGRKDGQREQGGAKALGGWGTGSKAEVRTEL